MFEAAKKFWGTPELVDKLLPFLDLESTLHLAQVHELTRDILQGSFGRNKLISRTCLQEGGDHPTIEEERTEVVKHLVEILKLLKKRKSNMLDLLETISKSSRPIARLGWSEPDFATMTPSNPNNPSHQVGLEGFLLLEAVEGAFGTSEQKLEGISLGFRGLAEPSLSVLSSRVARQEKKLTSPLRLTVHLESKKSAEALKTLMQASPEATVTIPPN